jgi:guanylate kinase
MKKILLIGKSCSGKSTLTKLLSDFGLSTAVSTTSRPQRDYEKTGVDYHFVSGDVFKKMLNDSEKFIEIDKYNEWYYGMTVEEFIKSDIVITTPRGLKTILSKYKRSDFIIILMESSLTLRNKRINVRPTEYDSFTRRWWCDDMEFEKLENYGGDWDLKIASQDNDAITNLFKLLTVNLNR